MIKINLLGEKVDNTALYTLQLMGFGLVTALALAGCLIHYQGVQSRVSTAETRKETLELQLQRLSKKTKKVDLLEDKKKLLASKLTTIATLKAKKQGPVRVLDDLTLAIPKTAWLNRIQQKGGGIEFKGVALDNQTVSKFMVTLENSAFFQDVDLKHSARTTRDNVKLQEFFLVAKITDPLKRRAEMEKAKKEKEAAAAAEEEKKAMAKVEAEKAAAEIEGETEAEDAETKNIESKKVDPKKEEAKDSVEPTTKQGSGTAEEKRSSTVEG